MASGLNMPATGQDITIKWNETLKGTTTTRAAGNPTNLPAAQNAWGVFIPLTGGRVRVAGNQIWSSGFYAVTTTNYYLRQKRYINSANRDITDITKTVLDPGVTTEVSKSFTESYIDIAYSFGYNITPDVDRLAVVVRLNGVVVYDATAGGPQRDGLTFTFHSGADVAPDSDIKAALGDDATRYPGQAYVLIKGIRPSEWGNAVPTSCDVEFYVQEAGSTPEPDGTLQLAGEGEAGPTIPLFAYPWFDRKKRLIYAFDPTLGTYGGHRVYDMQTLVQVDQKAWSFSLPAGVPADTAKLNSLPVYIEELGLVTFPSGPFGQSITYQVEVDMVTGAGRLWAAAGQPVSTHIGRGKGCVAYVSNGTAITVWLPVPSALNTGKLVCFSHGPNPRKWELEFVNLITADKIVDMLYIPVPGNDFAAIGVSNSSVYRVAYSADLQRPVFSFYIDHPQTTGLDDSATDPENSSLRGLATHGGELIVWNNLRISRWKANLAGQSTEVYVKPTPTTLKGFPRVIQLVGTAEPDTTTGTLGIIEAPANLVQIDLVNGTARRTPAATGGEYDTFLDPIYWDSLKGQWFGVAVSQDDTAQLLGGWLGAGGGISSGKMKLKDVIRGIYSMNPCFDASKLVFLDIEDEVAGVFISEAAYVNTIIDNITRLYRIEKTEDKGTITFFRKRSLSGETEIDADLELTDLALLDGGEVTDSGDVVALRTTRRGSEEEQAGTVNLTFIDMDNNCIPSQVTWTRPDAGQNASYVDYAVPLVMSKNDALQLCQAAMLDLNQKKTKFEFTLPPKWAHLTSGDVVRIRRSTYSEVIRITEDTFNANFSVSCLGEGVATDVGVATAIVPDATPARQDPLGPATDPLIIDATPVGQRVEPAAGNFVQYLSVMPRVNSGWRGGYLARQEPTWQTLFGLASDAAPLVLSASAAARDVRCRLDTSLLSASLKSGKIPAAPAVEVTVADLLKDPALNLAFFGAPGRWELVQYLKITAQGVHGMLRGRQGTDVHCGLHVAGDLFVPIDGLIREERPVSLKGSVQTFQAASNTQAFASGAKAALTVEAASQRPWAPARPKAARDPDTGDITVSWKRRDRKGGAWGGKPLPLSEAFEKYEVEVRGAGSIAAFRVLTADGIASVTYTADMQTEDGTTTETQLSVRIYQMSAEVGRGYPRDVVLDVE